jgi:hypothetical protein
LRVGEVTLDRLAIDLVRDGWLEWRDSKEAFRLRDLYRLAIDDPVADHLLGTAEVDLRELVAHFGDVVVDRPILVHEYAEGHQYALTA